MPAVVMIPPGPQRNWPPGGSATTLVPYEAVVGPTRTPLVSAPVASRVNSA